MKTLIKHGTLVTAADTIRADLLMEAGRIALVGADLPAGDAQVVDATWRNFAQGQNLLTLHGLYYSTYGGWWEWAPPCNHFRMPYWAHMGEFLGAVERLCAENPDVKFLVTLLALENQHQIAVVARKFPNLMLFGCWWFLNDPSLIEQITRMRLELLGTSMIPQHSDCRVLDQLVYKWSHSRLILADCLAEKHEMAAATGWQVTEADIQRDVTKILSANFWEFVGR